jgi:TonB family protein
MVILTIHSWIPNRIVFPTLLTFLLLWSSCTVPAGGKGKYMGDDLQYKGRYEIAFQENEEPLRYWYHDVVTKIPGGYRVRVFHPDLKTLIEDKVYRSSGLTRLHGPYKGYWDDGGIRAQGFYHAGQRQGTWLECEPGKGKSSSGPYQNDMKEGMWTQLDTNGLVESVYTWHEGKKHGKYFEFDTLGHKSNEGLYEADTLISVLHPRPELHKPYLKDCPASDEVTQQKCTQLALDRLVAAQLRYPEQARLMGMEGTAVVQWDVMPNGKVAHIRVPQGLSDEMLEASLKAIQGMPDWVPAHKEGKPLKWTMSLSIPFSL